MSLPNSSFKEALDRLSNDISAVFSVAFFELETIRSTAAEFGSDVECLLSAAATGDDRVKREGAFDAFLKNASSAGAAAESAAGSLTDRAFQNALIGVSGSLRDMKKRTVELTAISSLTKITQTETRDAADRLTAFIESLDSRCRQLQKATARSADLVVETQRQSGLARDELTAIALEFRALLDGADGEAEHLAELERRHCDHMSAIGKDAHRLDEEVRAGVGDLIGCLQFPDAFAQRMEHVRAALDAMEDASMAERGGLYAVAAAQLASMAKALAEVSATATRALEALTTALNQNPALHSRSEAANPSDAWMTATAQANETMLRSVARARQKLGDALTLLSGLTGQIDATQLNLEASVRLNRELEASVHNASLVAHRSGSQTSPLRFLAGAVKDVVGRTSEMIVRISEALTHIRQTSEELAASSLKSDLETLLDLQGTAVQEAAGQAGMVESVRGTRRRLLGHAGRLAGAATAGGNAFETAAEHAAAVSDLAHRIRDAAPAAYDASCSLDWLYALYTMEEERVVHRETLGQPAPVEAIAADDEDLGDFVL